MERNDLMNLRKEELIKIRGGGLSIGVWTLIGAGVVFLIGLIDGFVRPLKCN